MTIPSNCPPGYFRDYLFHIPDTIPDCESWTPYAICVALLLTFRYLLLVINLIVLIRIRSEQKRHGISPSRRAQKHRTFAWTPLLEGLHTLFLTILLITAPWVNAINGASWVCMALAFYSYFWGSLLFTAKIVKTSRLAAKSLIDPSLQSVHIQGNWYLTAWFSLFVISLHGFLISWIVGASILPGNLIANKIGEAFLTFLACASMSFCALETYGAYRILHKYATTLVPSVAGRGNVGGGGGGSSTGGTGGTMGAIRNSTDADSSVVSRQTRMNRTANKLWRSATGLACIVCILLPMCSCLVANVYHFQWQILIAGFTLAAFASALALQNFWRRATYHGGHASSSAERGISPTKTGTTLDNTQQQRQLTTKGSFNLATSYNKPASVVDSST
jgi:hypothetical protein